MDCSDGDQNGYPVSGDAIRWREDVKSEVVSLDLHDEFLTQERCLIIETWNSPDDPNVSIARARVRPGVTTALHYLEGVDERYLITSGRGIVELENLPPTEVVSGSIVVIPAGVRQRISNVGQDDLVFYCICTPRFSMGCYRDGEAS